jgi:acetyl esterase/lipase
VRDIVSHPAFKGFGELMLPWEDNTKYFDTRLNQVGSLMPYHGHVNADVVVGALNHLIDEADAGKTIFYDFYTERQKQEDPTKEYTGLFFYRGKPGAPFAIVCPGGGFSYVGSLHEGFPLAREISKKGLNAFVTRYRVGEQRATEDLAAEIAYVFKNAGTLGVSTQGYSLWGGSAGAGWWATSLYAAFLHTAAANYPNRSLQSSPIPDSPAIQVISRRIYYGKCG